jgi:NAD(P)-dependent dehydrogenase (short-subunit alcohol dehydrogenase family)
MGELEGKAALITGGTTGLGSEMARRFCEEGSRVVITGRDEELGRRAQDGLAQHGEIWFVRADASDAREVEASVAETVRLLGGLDILVNNAGIGVVAGVLDTPPEDFDRVMGVNVRGAFLYAKEAFSHLEARRGNMIHVSSDAGVSGEADYGIYSVSKAALIMLSNMLAIEGGRRGVRSNALCPGDTAPGMRHMAVPGEIERPDPVDGWPTPPIGRIGQALDVAEAAVFLASEKASFVNGVALLVDGGMRAGMRTSLLPDGTLA